jgi:hypothetical protein
MKVNKINLQRFLDFCKGFDLFSGINRISESPGNRKSNRLIFQFIFLMCVYGKTSFLAMDQAGRLEKQKRLFKLKRFGNCRYRHTVVSDTTLERRLPGIDMAEIRQINYTALLTALHFGWVQPVAIIDGTQWCGRLYSSLCFVTRWGDVWMVDSEPIEKKGKELLASQRLVERCCAIIGKGVIKLLLADMLYFNERFWQLRESGYVEDILVKYTPGSEELLAAPYRIVLQRFEEMKALYEKPEKSKAEKTKLYRMGFDCHDGYDQARGVSYRIYRLRNNSWDNRYQISQVLEKSAAQGEMAPFYVITTRKSMNHESLRENGHKRWYIENDGFKLLNAHLNSKRHWCDDEQVLDRLISIWALAFSLLCLFRKEYQHHIRKIYHRVCLNGI